MLDTRFPRLPGDVGHASTWRMPVRLQVVHGASPQRVVRMGDRALLQPFIDAARTLEAAGAQAITTSCGFLVRWQAELRAALRVPVWTSSLLLLPELAAVAAPFAVANAGVLTVDADSLGATELAAAGAPPDTPVQGLSPGCHLQSALLDNRPELDPAVAEADAVQAALELVRRHGGIRHIVLECTNLPPYARAIEVATARPVQHLIGMVQQRYERLR